MKIGGMQFKAINDETRRTYVFIRDGKQHSFTVDNPQWLHVSESGGHRIIAKGDGKDYGVYIPAGWVCLFWEAHAGKQLFAF